MKQNITVTRVIRPSIMERHFFLLPNIILSNVFITKGKSNNSLKEKYDISSERYKACIDIFERKYYLI